jgi:hypothetical protein
MNMTDTRLVWLNEMSRREMRAEERKANKLNSGGHRVPYRAIKR